MTWIYRESALSRNGNLWFILNDDRKIAEAYCEADARQIAEALSTAGSASEGREAIREFIEWAQVLVKYEHEKWGPKLHDPFEKCTTGICGVYKRAVEALSTAGSPVPSCEGTSNPYVASCGAKFDTYEEMAEHERTCKRKADPSSPAGTADDDAEPEYDFSKAERGKYWRAEEGVMCPRCARHRPRLHGDGEYVTCVECGYEAKRGSRLDDAPAVSPTADAEQP